MNITELFFFTDHGYLIYVFKPAIVLRKQLDKDREQLTKQHEAARAKMDQKLHEKLAERRFRLPPLVRSQLTPLANDPPFVVEVQS